MSDALYSISISQATSTEELIDVLAEAGKFCASNGDFARLFATISQLETTLSEHYHPDKCRTVITLRRFIKILAIWVDEQNAESLYNILLARTENHPKSSAWLDFRRDFIYFLLKRNRNAEVVETCRILRGAISNKDYTCNLRFEFVGDVLFQIGECPKSIAVYEELISIFRERMSSRARPQQGEERYEQRLLCKMSAASLSVDTESAKKIITEALHLDSDLLPKEKTQLEQQNISYPTHTDVLLTAGDVFYSAGNREIAIQYYEQAAKFRESVLPVESPSCLYSRLRLENALIEGAPPRPEHLFRLEKDEEFKPDESELEHFKKHMTAYQHASNGQLTEAASLLSENLEKYRSDNFSLELHYKRLDRCINWIVVFMDSSPEDGVRFLDTLMNMLRTVPSLVGTCILKFMVFNAAICQTHMQDKAELAMKNLSNCINWILSAIPSANEATSNANCLRWIALSLHHLKYSEMAEFFLNCAETAGADSEILQCDYAVIKARSGNVQAYWQKALLKFKPKAQGSPAPDCPEQIYKKLCRLATWLIQEARNEEAEELLLSLTPHYPSVVKELLRLYLRTNQLQLAEKLVAYWGERDSYAAELADLYERLGKFELSVMWFQKGQYIAAETVDHLMRAIVLQERLTGPNSYELIPLLDQASRLFRQLGNMDELKACLRKAARLEEVLGRGSRDAQRTYLELCSQQATGSELDEIYLELLDIASQAEGTSSLELFRTLSSAAHDFLRDGRPDRALGYIRLLLTKQSKLKMNGFHDLVGENVLRLVQYQLMKTISFAEAESLLLQAIQTCSETDGDIHVSVTSYLSLLANTYYRQRKDQELEETVDRILLAYEQGKGKDDVLNSLHALAISMDTNKETERALQLLERVMAAQRESLGPNNEHVFGTLHVYVSLLTCSERLEKSLVLLLEQYEGRYGGSSWQDSHIREQYISVLKKLGKISEAEQQLGNLKSVLSEDFFRSILNRAPVISQLNQTKDQA